MKELIIGGRICYIGEGEETTLELLKRLFPQAEFEQQAQLSKLFPKEELTRRQIKETIDILIRRKGSKIAVRVNNKDHQGMHSAQTDRTQKTFLQEAGFNVVDVNEYQCKEIFKEKINYLSYLEITNALFQGEVKP